MKQLDEVFEEQEEEWPPKAFFRNIHGVVVGNNNDHSRLVVTIVNYDYVDFADNFAQSLLRQNQSNFCLVPTDAQAYGMSALRNANLQYRESFYERKLTFSLCRFTSCHLP